MKQFRGLWVVSFLLFAVLAGPALANSGERRGERSGEHGGAERGEAAGEHGHEGGGEHSGGGEPGETGTQHGLSETAREVRSGVELIANYDRDRQMFTGTVRNTTNATVHQVRVEVHLSNGVELGPTRRVDLAPGETKSITLDARGQNFTSFAPVRRGQSFFSQRAADWSSGQPTDCSSALSTHS